MTVLKHLYRELHELECLAGIDRKNGDYELAIFHEHEAAEVTARINTLECADGMALGAPTFGDVA